MSRYWYDCKCADCERDCHFFGIGNYPSGEEYERCSNYGYILVTGKGDYNDSCDGYMSEDVWQAGAAQREKRAALDRKRGRR